jgi:hypothetical protein
MVPCPFIIATGHCQRFGGMHALVTHVTLYAL